MMFKLLAAAGAFTLLAACAGPGAVRAADAQLLESSALSSAEGANTAATLGYHGPRNRLNVMGASD